MMIVAVDQACGGFVELLPEGEKACLSPLSGHPSRSKSSSQGLRSAVEQPPQAAEGP
jgi:hypothetical protein